MHLLRRLIVHFRFCSSLCKWTGTETLHKAVEAPLHKCKFNVGGWEVDLTSHNTYLHISQ